MSISSGIVQPEIVESGASDYMALLKPRVMSLVVFTGLVGLLLAPGTLHPVLAGIAVLCIAIGAGASGFDKKTDTFDVGHHEVFLTYSFKLKKLIEDGVFAVAE